ncbi:MAG: nucleoside phosphorylase [Bacteroidia bacterium]|jgi:uridine phosphorylase|nr:nucleoside phosphorylase [Bacteroidia bacterium]
MQPIPESELILNTDGSVYHLNLLPEDIADTIIFVGDQDRVPEVSKHFDTIELRKGKREFITHTGRIGTKRLSVISTGIGTDNIDIVWNELNQLANINLSTRTPHLKQRKLKAIRIGTSGSLQPDIEVNTIVASSYGLGLDVLLHYYQLNQDTATTELLNSIQQQIEIPFLKPYLVKAPGNLLQLFNECTYGITATCAGFYAPQGRVVSTAPTIDSLIERLSKVTAAGNRITNFEMETAGIYGLANVFGHEAVSINAIMANRITHTFTRDAKKLMDQTIAYVLGKLTE